MTNLTAPATEREWELLDIIHSIRNKGKLQGDDHMRLLNLGIDLEDLATGMGDPAEYDISQGKYDDWLAIWALRRWAAESRGLVERRR